MTHYLLILLILALPAASFGSEVQVEWGSIVSKYNYFQLPYEAANRVDLGRRNFNIRSPESHRLHWPTCRIGGHHRSADLNANDLQIIIFSST